jgi:hypothetical protein
MNPTIALLAVLTGSAPTHAAAQAEPLPPARQVLERYVEATGGRAVYEKMRHRTLTGTFELKGAGMSGKLLLQQSAPGKMLLKIDLPGFGTIVKGTDGIDAWEVVPASGPRLLEGQEKAETLLEAAFNAELRPEDTYSKMETVRVEEVDGKPAYVLELTPRAGGPPRISYYDRQSGLLLKFVGTSTTPMGELKAESTVSDYRKEGGLLVPHRLTLAAMGVEQVMTFDSFSTAPVPDSAYAVPAELKALPAPAPVPAR